MLRRYLKPTSARALLHHVQSRTFSKTPTVFFAEDKEASYFYEESPSKKFKLSEKFIEKYKNQPAPFGFNGLGEIVYKRTYSRVKENGENEQWYETVERVVNGTYNMQKSWIEAHQLGWNPWKAQKSAQEMYTRIFKMKFLPPGRGLWAMGSPLTEKKGVYAALNNCAFVSTETIKDDPSKPFVFLMDLSMLGVGVGFDTKGAGLINIDGPDHSLPTSTFVIPDSREGWVESLKVLLDSHFKHTAPIQFDYSQIRPAGEPIKGFGGVSSGPESLKRLHDEVEVVLSRKGPISVTTIVDIMNYIGKCVVAGNIRQTAEIAFGDPTSDEFINLKNYEMNPHRSGYGWTSNNSIFAKLGMDYSKIVDKVAKNGEPGFAWLENMQKYSRMNGTIDNKDFRARGGNPCLEQTLESFEMCCLVETFPTNHDSIEDYIATLKMAFLYAKTVTLAKTHWPESNRVMLRNRRVGCSMSGIAQFIGQRGIEQFRSWCQSGYQAIQNYDREFSDWLAIPSSIKTTSIKPSGTVSLLAGATPGMHYPESRFYIRRIRLSVRSTLVTVLRSANYPVEPAVDDPTNTVVAEFPIDVGEGIRIAADLSMWEQLSLASFLQEHWADNQVSCTVTFDPKTEAKQLQYALDYFQYKLKGISFLPRFDVGQKKAYPQMPYEEITQEEYEKRLAAIHSLVFEQAKGEIPSPDKFCDVDTCQIDVGRQQK